MRAAIASDRVATAVEAGTRFLRDSQSDDGHWTDFALPVGASDGWVTAYTTHALLDAGPKGPDPVARAAGAGGAEWLRRVRHYRAGWGYNGTTGPDADSTAWALRALRAAGLPNEEGDRLHLMAYQRDDGGFATYLEGPGSWSAPQSEITAVAALALGTDSEVGRNAVAYVTAQRDSDHSWPTYWWARRHYSTMVGIEATAAAGVHDAAELPVVSLAPERQLVDAFDIACVMIACLIGSPASRSIRGELTRGLVDLQLGDGSWGPSEALRLTDPGVGGAALPTGRIYSDMHRVFTTASAVRALSRAGIA